MQPEHRRLHVALEQEVGGIQAARERRLDQLAFGSWRRGQHVVRDQTLVAGVAYADPQSPEPVGAELRSDVLEAIVSGDTPTKLELHHPREKIELVVHDENFL